MRDIERSCLTCEEHETNCECPPGDVRMWLSMSPETFAAAESRGRVAGLREAAEALDADLQHAIDELHEGRTPFGGDTLRRFAYGVKAHIAARLDALAGAAEES